MAYEGFSSSLQVNKYKAYVDDAIINRDTTMKILEKRNNYKFISDVKMTQKLFNNLD